MVSGVCLHVFASELALTPIAVGSDTIFELKDDRLHLRHPLMPEQRTVLRLAITRYIPGHHKIRLMASYTCPDSTVASLSKWCTILLPQVWDARMTKVTLATKTITNLQVRPNFDHKSEPRTLAIKGISVSSEQGLSKDFEAVSSPSIHGTNPPESSLQRYTTLHLFE